MLGNILSMQRNKRNKNTNSTSEVGCNQPTLTIDEEDQNEERGAVSTAMQQMWREFFNSQGTTMLEMLRNVREPCASVGFNTTLPKYNPDSGEADAGAWCAVVDMLVGDKPFEGNTLILSLSSALLGDASQWFTQICFTGMTWCQFKELFLRRFGSTDTSAAVVMNWLNSRPKTNEPISSFGCRMINSLEAKWKHLTIEEIAVSVTLAHMSQIDARLKRLVCTTELKTRIEFQHELKAFTFGMEKQNRSDEIIPTKRPKLFSHIKCHYCGKDGHKIAECRARRESQRSISTSGLPNKEKISCFRCGVMGHIASSCPKREASSVIERKRIDICEVVQPSGVLTQAGESIPFFFDTGAECTLIKEKVANKLSGERINNVVVLKGIGDATILSTVQILSVVIITDVAVEILFHVVSDNYLKYDVLLGREILSLGFDVLVSANNFSITRCKIVYICSKQDKQVNLNNLNTDLVGSDKSRLVSLIQTYKDYFIQGHPCRRIKTGQLEIRLIDDNKTVQRRPYRLSEGERKIVREMISELEQAGIVRPSSSPFASPILLVKKKDGTDRMCVDFRELNLNTVADKYPLPLIADQIARLRGGMFFSCIDMASGFHQVSVHTDSIERTAFVTPDGQYEFLSMPFGLKNAPAVFQRAIIKALGELVNSYVIVYIDDVMIASTTIEEGFERLNIVLTKLSDAGFSFNANKCAFLKTTIDYLGFEIKCGEVRPNPRKIVAISALPPPQSITQLRQFIGLASYFRQFINNFSEIMKPLYALTSNKTLVWKPEYEEIRQKIICLLTTHPVLVIFDPQYPIELHTDASAEGYGAILMHKIDNKSRVIEYYSKTTTDAESRYHSYELETLAVVNAIKHFRHYLFGRKFTVYTDCNSLKATQTKRELTPRVHRWWAYMQNFDFDVQYREGKRMAHVDFLSRNPLPSSDIYQKVEAKQICMADVTDNWFLAEQQRDVQISSLIVQLREGNVNNSEINSYELRSGILHRKIQRNGQTKCLPVVPRSFKWSIVSNVHESIMHLGWKKTLDKIYENYWFEKMNKYVRKFVEACVTCKLAKSSSGKIQAELHPIPKISIPWHTIHVDITGKLSGKSDKKEYVIVQIDAFSKYVLLHHTLSLDADSCINAIKSSISLFGIPTRIIADQGRCFAGKAFRSFCNSQNIKLHLIATGACRANGQVERVMSTLKNMLTAVETSQRSWQDALGEVQIALNSTTHRVTKCSPLELLIGKIARPLNLISVSNDDTGVDRDKIRKCAEDNMKSSASYDKQRFDKNKAKIVKFIVNDLVLLKNEERHQLKLDPKFRGPFKIVEILEGDRYLLQSLKGQRTYKYAHDRLRKLPESFSPL